LNLMSTFREVMGRKEFYGNIVECSYDHEQCTKEAREFYDIVYQSDTDSIEHLINQSQLHQEWLKNHGKEFNKDEPYLNPEAPKDQVNKIYTTLSQETRKMALFAADGRS
jgi:hypothetical protein